MLLLCVLGLHLHEVLHRCVLGLHLHQVLLPCVRGLHLHQVLPLCVLVQAVVLCRLQLCVLWL
jgi:hypothetical protein